MNTYDQTMTPAAAQTAIAPPDRSILQELWETKAKMNAEANYDVRRVVELARLAAAPFIGADGRVRLRPDLLG